jgi:hypothetical protein
MSTTVFLKSVIFAAALNGSLFFLFAIFITNSPWNGIIDPIFLNDTYISFSGLLMKYFSEIGYLVLWGLSLSAVFFGFLIHLRGASGKFLTALIIATILLSSAFLFSFRFEFMAQHRFRLPADNLGYLYPPAIFKFYLYFAAITLFCCSILLIAANSLFELTRTLAKKGK